MTWFGSSEEDTIESTGEVNNNVILNQTSLKEGSRITWIITGILAIKLIELVYIAHKSYRRSLKKKYNVNGAS